MKIGGDSFAKDLTERTPARIISGNAGFSAAESSPAPVATGV